MNLYRFTLADGKPEHYTHSLESAQVRMSSEGQRELLATMKPGMVMPVNGQWVERLT